MDSKNNTNENTETTEINNSICIINTIDTIDTIDTIEILDTPETSETSDTPETIESCETSCSTSETSETNETNETNNSIETSTPITTPLYMVYDEKKEMDDEIQLLNYHTKKDYGYWKIAKMIISHSNKDKNNTEFFLDSLDFELRKNYDNLENIEKVFYTNNLDVDIVYEFEGKTAIFIIENLKIIKYKPLGYLFNKDINQNKWDFTISVITSKGIYTSNRYISETQLGYYA